MRFNLDKKKYCVGKYNLQVINLRPDSILFMSHIPKISVLLAIRV